ncbi:MAG: single-stranded DNA-binding protein [Candidatus Tyrphobacter sp.]
MNTITIHGNLTKDVETGSKGEVSYARFTLASDRHPSAESKTDFFNVVIFESGDLEDLVRGTWVKVTGTVRLGEYDGKPTIEVVAKTIERKALKQEDPA